MWQFLCSWLFHFQTISLAVDASSNLQPYYVVQATCSMNCPFCLELLQHLQDSRSWSMSTVTSTVVVQTTNSNCLYEQLENIPQLQ